MPFIKHNSFETHLYQPHSTRLTRWFFTFLFLLNDHIFHNKTFESIIWNQLKCDLFYIAGQCQHSGNCCRNLMIFEKSSPIKTPEGFEKKCKSSPVFKRFIPQKTMPNKIHSYMCRSLTKSNYCSDYESRPAMCKHYPISNFLMNAPLLEGCGYKVCKKQPFPKIKNKRLLALIDSV